MNVSSIIKASAGVQMIRVTFAIDTRFSPWARWRFGARPGAIMMKKARKHMARTIALWFLTILTFLLALCAPVVRAQTNATNKPEGTNAPSKFRSPDDGWLDASGFLEETYGFLPVPLIITEPAVGYGGGAGLMFLSKPLPRTEDGLGFPNITVVGGFGTENGTWGTFGADMRYWLDQHLQTFVGFINSSVNLDYYGIGDDPALANHPLRYNLQPTGGTARVKYRFEDSRVWAGLNYAFTATEVSFDEPPGAPGEPAFRHKSNVGGFTPSLTFDTRDNFFTPNRGTYLETSAGFFAPAFGADEDFQRASLVAMQFIPLGSKLFLGFRADAAASFGNEPFYLRPYISLRGAPTLRYQGEEVAQIETELRQQIWKRFSLVGFVGGGAAWNNLEKFNSTQTIVTGGAGFRYEIARAYGLYAGLDVARGPDDTAVYIQIGSAWSRP
jgi:Omp85 superfamily domain